MQPSSQQWSGTPGRRLLPTPPMETPRANHTATLLADGRVLVTGGTGTGGLAVPGGEIYDPSANTWTPTAHLNVARRGHTATLLPDGTVLIAGGDDAGTATDTLEIFDPLTGTFAYVDGHLSAARTLHAAAALADGRVFIVGGFERTNPSRRQISTIRRPAPLRRVRISRRRAAVCRRRRCSTGRCSLREAQDRPVRSGPSKARTESSAARHSAVSSGSRSEAMSILRSFFLITTRR